VERVLGVQPDEREKKKGGVQTPPPHSSPVVYAYSSRVSPTKYTFKMRDDIMLHSYTVVLKMGVYVKAL